MRVKTAGIVLAAMTIAAGCDWLNPNKQLNTHGASVRIIDDSPEVGRLLAAQRARDSVRDPFWKDHHTQAEGIEHVREIERNPERYIPGRRDFLLAMSQQPGVSVAEGIYARSLGASHALCIPYPMATSEYIKVRITSGPLRGREGRMCDASVFRTVVMP